MRLFVTQLEFSRTRMHVEAVLRADLGVYRTLLEFTFHSFESVEASKLVSIENCTATRSRCSSYTVRMDIYDFDGTLYEGDSTADFLKHCLRRYPKIALTLPRTVGAAIACFGLHTIDKAQFKAALYRFLLKVPDIDHEVEAFWQLNQNKITGPCNPQPGDLIISASPDFLLRDICEKQGWSLIASQVDPYTGNVLGPNCSGEQKVKRFREEFPTAEVGRFYSDSHNDDPMAACATEAFFVKDGVLQPWS